MYYITGLKENQCGCVNRRLEGIEDRAGSCRAQQLRWGLGTSLGLRPGECHALIISLKVVPGTDKE